MNGATFQAQLRSAWDRLALPGRIAAALGLLAAVVVVTSGWGLVRALLVPSALAQDVAQEDKVQAEKLKASFDGWIAQTQGRSLFLIPGPKLAVEEKPPEPEPTAEESKPSSYGGPGIIAMINERVWFDDGKVVAAGAEKEGDLRVVSLDSPWSAKVEWKGVEFTVPFFAHDAVVIPPVEPPKPPSPGEPALAPQPPSPDEPASAPTAPPAALTPTAPAAQPASPAPAPAPAKDNP